MNNETTKPSIQWQLGDPRQRTKQTFNLGDSGEVEITATETRI